MKFVFYRILFSFSGDRLGGKNENVEINKLLHIDIGFDVLYESHLVSQFRRVIL